MHRNLSDLSASAQHDFCRINLEALLMPKPSPVEQLEKIKELAIIGMFSDDELLDVLVLKGGNALDLIYRISTRASIDVDLSIADDVPGGAEAFLAKAERALTVTYRDADLFAFDFKLEEKPKVISEDLQAFWGGYRLTFKLLTLADSMRLTEIDARRREAIRIGPSSNFEIEVSRFEFVEPKVRRELHGIQVFVYSPEMIVAEKLRALCQQMPEYNAVIHRNRPGTSRARDFVDIHLLITECGLDMTTPDNRELLHRIFRAKHVPLEWLHKLPENRSLHEASFPAVEATIKPGIKLRSFDYYFRFVLAMVEALEIPRHP